MSQHLQGIERCKFCCSDDLKGHIRANLTPVMVCEGINYGMPSLFRFLFVVATIAGIVFGGLWVLATHYEPDQQTISKPVPSVKIRR